ncbi:MAG TPA: peptidase [Gammaproteobacteria bacterium]|nr:peptidase [Gammaproteobacteria bacterium]
MFARCLCLALALLLPRATPADGDHDIARELRRSGDILPLEQILEQVKRLHPGHVLEVELDRHEGRYIYEIETLDARGNVWEMRFDAQSGRLLETEREE